MASVAINWDYECKGFKLSELARMEGLDVYSVLMFLFYVEDNPTVHIPDRTEAYVEAINKHFNGCVNAGKCLITLAYHDLIVSRDLMKGSVTLNSVFYCDLKEIKGYKSPPNYRIHADEVYERDGHKCVYCGSPHELSLDHFIPQSKGGSHDPSNLVTACRSCNSSKGDKLFGDWLKARNFTV